MAQKRDRQREQQPDEIALMLQNMNDISQALKKLHHHENCLLDIVEQEEQRGGNNSKQK